MAAGGFAGLAKPLAAFPLKGRAMSLDRRQLLTGIAASRALGGERLRECQWESCTRFTIPRDWPSGVYLGKLSATQHRYQSYVIFIVRDDRPADFLFQCSDNTWQAYNQWPDSYSLYTNDRNDRIVLTSGVKV